MKEKITRDEVRHVARLARLELTGQEEARLTDQMNQILCYMERLNELNTTDCPATTHAIQLHNVFRQDAVQASLDRAGALANAPDSDGACFRVPKVI